MKYLLVQAMRLTRRFVIRNAQLVDRLARDATISSLAEETVSSPALSAAIDYPRNRRFALPGLGKSRLGKPSHAM